MAPGKPSMVHIREGIHDVTGYDRVCCMDFADKHFGKTKKTRTPSLQFCRRGNNLCARSLWAPLFCSEAQFCFYLLRNIYRCGGNIHEWGLRRREVIYKAIFVFISDRFDSIHDLFMHRLEQLLLQLA